MEHETVIHAVPITVLGVTPVNFKKINDDWFTNYVSRDHEVGKHYNLSCYNI